MHMTDAGGARISLAFLKESGYCLDESQQWSLALGCTAAVQKEAEDAHHFKAFCLEELYLTDAGGVQLERDRSCDHAPACLPSEFASTSAPATEIGLPKIYVFYLGCWFSELLISNCTAQTDSSLILHSVVNMMKLEISERRIDLGPCKQIITNQVKLLCISPEQVLQSLWLHLAALMTDAEAVHEEEEVEGTYFVYRTNSANIEFVVAVKTKADVVAQFAATDKPVAGASLPQEEVFLDFETSPRPAVAEAVCTVACASPEEVVLELSASDDSASSVYASTSVSCEDTWSIFGSRPELDSDFATPRFVGFRYQHAGRHSAGSLACLSQARPRIARVIRSFSTPSLANVGVACLDTEGGSDDSSLLCFSLAQSALEKCRSSGRSSRSRGSAGSVDSASLAEPVVQEVVPNGHISQPVTEEPKEPSPPVPTARRKKRSSLVPRLTPSVPEEEEEPLSPSPFVRNSFRGIRTSRGVSSQRKSSKTAGNERTSQPATHQAKNRWALESSVTGEYCTGKVVASNIRRQSGKTRRQSMTVPVFSSRERLPSIRLKAPSTGEQRKLFCKVRDGNVLVILLNGQRVDVTCKTNSTALDIFEVVSRHANLAERHFFGLTYLKDGEYFFLEPEQKIHRFAPPGWRQPCNDKVRLVYCLYLRLKFYPILLDFVKTEPTMHHIYLQLRHDIMEDRLQCEQESAYQLAALALQAEKGDRPTQEVYFEPEAYLPLCYLKNVNMDGVRARLAQMHYRHKGKSRHEAEVEYFKMCQALREYGVHFYRLYRTKPSELLTISPLGDPDTGTPLWIGIMSRGLVIFEEKGGLRIPRSHHPWHLTQTLQFDHKKFFIVTKSPDGKLDKLIFFTDSYRKSSYFVNFAAVQHRFCLKMRSWSSTLPRRGVGQAGSAGSDAQGQNSAADKRRTISGAHQERPVDVEPDGSEPAPPPRPAVPRRRSRVSADVGLKSRIAFLSPGGDQTANSDRLDASVGEGSEKPSFVDSEYDIVSATLVKDPRYGLGLTLVDGEIQGLKGVYIRSMTVGGPAELNGRLKIGDKVVAINGQSLDGRCRLDAVNMVRDSDASVALKVLRLRCLYSSEESVADTVDAGRDQGWPVDLAVNASDLSVPEENLCSTPLKSTGAAEAADSVAYGSLYHYSDTDEETSSGNEAVVASNGPSVDQSLSRQNLSSVQDAEALERSFDKIGGFGDKDWADSIEYDSKWNDDEVDLVEVVLEKTESGSLGIQVAGGKGQKGVYIKRIVGEPALSCPNIQPRDRLAMVNGQSTETLTHGEAVALLRTAKSPVVLKLWRSRANERSMSNGGDLDSQPRKTSTIVVLLEKSESQPLGLSLGKPVSGSEGIFIRSIAAGSVAAVDGRLQVGDKIIKIDNDYVSDLTHEQVVQRLKTVVGTVCLTVDR